ncbi:50S ribosomal protein L18-like [Lolium rigidum]|uniref:50S ribosomal protein L18-like n=1 Tax=Lolium rigidum TaxID=89674 RepID=UPI001F5DC8A3|nr:50S ribosomal protein L18-like [Lolium rigidum]XP_047084693.1 50S ribosomal protein L18-like [Lolium rigidum]
MKMLLLGAALCRPPLPCPSTSSCSLTSRHNCSTSPFPRQPGVVMHRRMYPKIEATARHGARKENAKVRNRRHQKKFNGTETKPRLSVFCSNKQLYAMLVDDHGKRMLFYASTLQEAICGEPPCSTVEAARKVGEELVKACKELDISEVSCYDRNGFARGEKMMAFEDPIAQHGFLPR